MHSYTSRFNSLMMFTATVLAVMCALFYFHARLQYDPHPEIDFQLTDLMVFMRAKQWDHLSYRFNLTADLSSLYNWNLKQLYVYIEAEWEDSNFSSRAIVADWILQTPNDRGKSQIEKAYKILATNKNFQYALRDIHFGLLGKTIKFSVNVEYLPFVGYISKERYYEIQKILPAQYKK